MSRRTRNLLAVGVVLVAWCAITVRWATQPLSDTLPVGKNVDKTVVVQKVECGTVLGSDPTGGNAPPKLVTPDDGNPNTTIEAWKYPRSPCALVHQQARLVFGIDVFVFALGVIALAVVVTHTRRAARLSQSAVPA